MQSKHLRGLIRELVSEVLQEDTNVLVTTKAGVKPISYKSPSEINKLKSDPNVSNIETTGGQRIKEMARIAKGYQLVDPEVDSTPFAGRRVSGTSIADVIEFFKENPGAEKTAIQAQFNFVRPQIANAIVNALVDEGILVRTDIETNPDTGEEVEPNYDIDAEDFFIGSRLSNRATMPFSGEEEPETEEPSIPELPLDNPVTKVDISDEDYQAWMKFSDLVERLARTKSAISQFKKQTRGGDDLSGDSSDFSRLLALKTSLETRINDLISSNEYVRNKSTQSKPNEDEINESVMKRLKKLANI